MNKLLFVFSVEEMPNYTDAVRFLEVDYCDEVEDGGKLNGGDESLIVPP